MNALLDRNVPGINKGWTTLIVHRKTKPNPPNEKPVANNPKKTMVKTFQHLVLASTTEPNKQM